MSGEMETKSRRDKFGERLRTKHPDKEFVDDEALFGQVDDDYADYEDQIGRYKEREDRMNEVMSRHPHSAQFLADMANGKNPWISVVEWLGIDGVMDMMNDPEKQEAIAAANKEYLERMAKEKGLEEEYQANFAESMDVLERMQREKGLSDEEIDGAMDLLQTIVHDAIVGKFSEETIEMAIHAVNRDTELEDARNEGEIAGRNAKIDEKLRKAKGGDGLPAMGGTNNAPTRQNANAQTIFDIYRGED